MNNLQLDSDSIDHIYPLEYITVAAKAGDAEAIKELKQRLVDRARYRVEQSQKHNKKTQ